MRHPNDRGGRNVNPDSVKHRAEVAGLNKWTVYRRLRDGWPRDRALSEPARPRLANPKSPLGIKRNTVAKRLRSGWPLEIALNRPLCRVL